MALPAETPRLGRGNALHLSFAAQVSFELGKHAQHVEEALPAAVEVSISCSMALSAAPLALKARTTSCRSPVERASRST